jgi:hypothetical protein
VPGGRFFTFRSPRPGQATPGPLRSSGRPGGPRSSRKNISRQMVVGTCGLNEGQVIGLGVRVRQAGSLL